MSSVKWDWPITPTPDQTTNQPTTSSVSLAGERCRHRSETNDIIGVRAWPCFKRALKSTRIQRESCFRPILLWWSPQRADRSELNAFAEIVRELDMYVDETDRELNSRALFVVLTAKLLPLSKNIFVICGGAWRQYELSLEKLVKTSWRASAFSSTKLLVGKQGMTRHDEQVLVISCSNNLWI